MKFHVKEDNSTLNAVVFATACYALFVSEYVAGDDTATKYNYLAKYQQQARWPEWWGDEDGPNRFKRSAYCTGHSGVMAIVMAVRCNAMHKMQCYASAFMHMCKCMRQRHYTLFLCALIRIHSYFFRRRHRRHRRCYFVTHSSHAHTRVLTHQETSILWFLLPPLPPHKYISFSCHRN